MRRPPQTTPVTYTSWEVAAIFQNAVTPASLQSLDIRGHLRPSFYFDSTGDGALIPAGERDLRVQERGRGRGDPGRRYTYLDLVWLRLFIYLKEGFIRAQVPKAVQRAGEILNVVRAQSPDNCPPSWRLSFVGKNVYLLRDDLTAECLNDGQLAMTQLLIENAMAEVRGRVEALAAHRKIRAASLEDAFSETAQSREAKDFRVR
jgi:hypothetical protein